MAKAPGDWVADRTLGGKAMRFEWTLDAEGNVTIRREAIRARRVFRRDHLERLQEFLADRAWHPATQRSERALGGKAGRSIEGFARTELGWGGVHREMVSHLCALFANACLWDWNQQRMCLSFRQMEGGLEGLRRYFERHGDAVAPRATRHDRRLPRKGAARGPQFDFLATFRGLSKGLRARFEACEGGTHPGEKGQRRETALREFLRAHLPLRYGVTRGEVIAYTAEASKQVDVLVYDALHSPVLLATEASSLLAAESVLAAIEVKPRLRRSDLAVAAANLRSVKVLPTHALLWPRVRQRPTFQPRTNPPIFGAVFAFESDPPKELAQALRELQKDAPPSTWVDCVCVLDRAVLYRSGMCPGVNNWSPYDLGRKETFLECEEWGPDSLAQFFLMLYQDISLKALLPPDLHRYSMITRLPLGKAKAGPRS